MGDYEIQVVEDEIDGVKSECFKDAREVFQVVSTMLGGLLIVAALN